MSITDALIAVFADLWAGITGVKAQAPSVVPGVAAAATGAGSATSGAVAAVVGGIGGPKVAGDFAAGSVSFGGGADPAVPAAAAVVPPLKLGVVSGLSLMPTIQLGIVTGLKPYVDPYPLGAGWLGAIVAYGVTIQAIYTKRQIEKYQPLPDAISSQFDHTENKELWCLSRSEPPPPTVSLRRAGAVYDLKNAYAGESMSGAYRSDFLCAPFWGFKPTPADMVKWWGASAVSAGVTTEQHIVNNNLSLYVWHGRRVCDLFTAARKKLLWDGIKNVKSDRYLDLNLEHVPPEQPGKIPASSSLEYWARSWQYYANARWLVWAAEVWREHATGANPPAWWIDYAVAWNVGAATAARCLDVHKGGRRDSLTSGTRYSYNMVFKPPTNFYTEHILRKMIVLVPPPGAIESGTELHDSRVANWPALLGDLAPGIMTPDHWVERCLENDGKAEYRRGMVFMNIVMAATSTMLTAAGGQVFGAVIGAVTKLCMAEAMAEAAGGHVRWSDVLGSVVAIASAFGVQEFLTTKAENTLASLAQKVAQTSEELERGATMIVRGVESAKAEYVRQKQNLATVWGNENVKMLMGSVT